MRHNKVQMRRGQGYHLPHAVVSSENVTPPVWPEDRGTESRLWGIPWPSCRAELDGWVRAGYEKYWKIVEKGGRETGPWAGCGGGCGRKTVRTG